MPQQQNLSVPIAIIVAGALVAGALYFAGRTATPSVDTNNPSQAGGEVANLVPVSSDDHIIGNPDADIIIVEYSDIECPFCKQFHVTMQQIMNEYGKDGKVAWVYRHFPLAQLHPNAPTLAEASECIAEQAGNAGFWKFLDEVFTVAPVGSFFPLDQLTPAAEKVGANGALFEQCMTSGKYKDKITKEFGDAVASGGQGTPHNIIVTKDGQKIPLAGAQPYATVKNVIETILAESK